MSVTSASCQKIAPPHPLEKELRNNQQKMPNNTQDPNSVDQSTIVWHLSIFILPAVTGLALFFFCLIRLGNVFIAHFSVQEHCEVNEGQHGCQNYNYRSYRRRRRAPIASTVAITGNAVSCERL